MTKSIDCIQKMMEMQKKIRKLYGPLEEIRKMMEEQKAIRKLYGPPEYIRKMMEEHKAFRKLYGPPEYIRKMMEDHKAIRKLYGPPEEIRKMMEEHKAIRKLCEPPEYIRKTIEKQETFREMFAPNGAANNFLQSLFDKCSFNPSEITERIWSLSNELSAPEFSINTDGSLSLEEQSIGLSELSIAVSGFFEEISEGCSIETLLSRLARLKKPAQRVAIWIFNNIILTYFIGAMVVLSTPSLQNYLDSNNLNSRREVIHAIKKAPCEINLDHYNDFRVVTANILNLRQQPSMKSNIITQFKRGKIVRVIQKKKNWTKVKSEGSSNLTGDQVGWVATRYITPLKR